MRQRSLNGGVRMSAFWFCVIMFVVCFVMELIFENCISEKAELKFFLFWLGICILLYFIFTFAAAFYAFMAYCIVAGADSEKSSGKGYGSACSAKKSSSSDSCLYDKVYEDGTRRVKNLSKTGYYYSDGKESWEGMLGQEVRSNGEVVYDNAYIPGRRDIYDKNGKYVRYEYENLLGITHRVDN